MSINLSCILALVDRSTLLCLLSDESKHFKVVYILQVGHLSPYKLRKPIPPGNI